MTVTIQKVTVRRSFLVHAGELYGVPLSVAQLDDVDDLDDLTALRRCFPWLSAEDLQEALWALGQPS